jgi:NAD(P)-dependent dehydrogenase (short-subunit alcohol dehydrogenase family)
VVEEAGRCAVTVSGDVGDAGHCRNIVDPALGDLGAVDILVNNAGSR